MNITRNITHAELIHVINGHSMLSKTPIEIQDIEIANSETVPATSTEILLRQEIVCEIKNGCYTYISGPFLPRYGYYWIIETRAGALGFNAPLGYYHYCNNSFEAEKAISRNFKLHDKKEQNNNITLIYENDYIDKINRTAFVTVRMSPPPLNRKYAHIWLNDRFQREMYVDHIVPCKFSELTEKIAELDAKVSLESYRYLIRRYYENRIQWIGNDTQFYVIYLKTLFD